MSWNSTDASAADWANSTAQDAKKKAEEILVMLTATLTRLQNLERRVGNLETKVKELIRGPLRPDGSDKTLY